MSHLLSIIETLASISALNLAIIGLIVLALGVIYLAALLIKRIK